MGSDNVYQLQTLSRMMKEQLSLPADSAMILGIAGGNGLEHIEKGSFSAVYGIDVNADYLARVQERYAHLGDMLTCLCVDLTTEYGKLPHADLLIADLLIEYIGYDCFKNVVNTVAPKYVSCGIQNDPGEGFVSDTPYLHSFDALDIIHHTLYSDELTECMISAGYRVILTRECPLPNLKSIIRTDFIRN
ncbi:MAG: methyltransferase type 11 [Oscillospiraceae bacterium]|nr:methyltransferase type 11 [Oscillospiraceae bacterium]